MNPLSLALVVLGEGLEVVLIARALVTRTTQKFPLFYSYIVFVLGCEIIASFILFFYHADYASFFWFYLLTRMFAEFAVLWGVSDHIFQPYPLVRNMGRLVIILTCIVFALWYWVPLARNPQPSWIMYLNLIKISAITKAAAIAALLAFARSFRIQVSRNGGGILLGFAAYLTAHAVLFGAATHFGRAIYAPVLSLTGPAGFGVCLVIWTVALWNPDAVAVHLSAATQATGAGARRPEFQLRRFSTFVTRLLWK
jgi:hypothetical protein